VTRVAVERTSRISRRRQAALAEGSEEYAARRAELIRVAANVFRTKGYDVVKLSDIAEAFGADRASLYYYVGSKEELLREATKGILDGNVAEADRILALTDANPREKLEMLIERLVTSYEQHYPYMSVWVGEHMLRVAGQDAAWAKQMQRQTHRFEKVVLVLLEEGRQLGLIRSDIPSTLQANALFGMLNWTHRWYSPRQKHGATEIAAAFSTIFFDGVTAPS
jgi:AcrR family transcriptional regulator